MSQPRDSIMSMNAALFANNLPSYCHHHFCCAQTQMQPRKVMTKMGVKFSKIRKKSCKQAKVILTPYVDSLCAIVRAEMKVFVVWAALAAITSAWQCQLPPCSDQLGLSPQGNITWVQPAALFRMKVLINEAGKEKKNITKQRDSKKTCSRTDFYQYVHNI